MVFLRAIGQESRMISALLKEGRFFVWKISPRIYGRL
jgi:hypothetical protein